MIFSEISPPMYQADFYVLKDTLDMSSTSFGSYESIEVARASTDSNFSLSFRDSGASLENEELCFIYV
uniref:Uncharacterized protein n=1 Tax=Acrobeloides nanus TaxID=290746 RepID=A0A914DGT6_9BILA